jgi:aryl-alcohol dehydrogenase-like predicted oxidoreductase
MDEFRAVAPLHTAQPPYNLFERSIERNVLPYCTGRKLITLAYGIALPRAVNRADDGGHAVRR